LFLNRLVRYFSYIAGQMSQNQVTGTSWLQRIPFVGNYLDTEVYQTTEVFGWLQQLPLIRNVVETEEAYQIIVLPFPRFQIIALIIGVWLLMIGAMWYWIKNFKKYVQAMEGKEINEVAHLARVVGISERRIMRELKIMSHTLNWFKNGYLSECGTQFHIN